MKTILLLLTVLLTGCATMVNDEKTNIQAKTQCPIGYHLVQTPSKVIFASGYDKNKHAVEFKCVADSAKDSDKEYGVGH